MCPQESLYNIQNRDVAWKNICVEDYLKATQEVIFIPICMGIKKPLKREERATTVQMNSEAIRKCIRAVNSGVRKT